MTYVCLTSLVLIFLNIYSSRISQKLFYNGKEISMLEKCQIAATEIGNLEVQNHSTISSAISSLDLVSGNRTRVVVTNRNGMLLFDSRESRHSEKQYFLLPEIVEALSSGEDAVYGHDVFTWDYHAGMMHSKAATPILSYDTVVGCVYMREIDSEQGALIESLQKTVLTLTLFLELAVILFSLIFSHAYTKRLRKIMVSMRIIREGDYSHSVAIGGRDELTVLGNEFNDLVDRLRTSEQKRNNFVSDASHELKTPLASIKLLSDSILQNDMDTSMVREFVADIGNEADRLNRMSQKLLSLTKSENQNQENGFEIVEIAPTVERVVRMLSEIANASNISIHLDLYDPCPILILEDDLYQIIFNLAENAIKYNIPGGSLTITLSRQNENAILTIKDTGMGIPADSLAHIFERFYRVDKARSRKSGGSGLGLSIVRNMVERNNGEIRVASQEGTGTEFTVIFPIFDTEEET